jgi:hypothetical protein
MKENKLQVQCSLKIEGASLDPNHTDHIQGHFDDIVMCRKNAGKVIWGSLSLEQQLDEIIKSYLFERNTAKSDFFMTHFLKTNRVDFSAKIQAALLALKESQKVKGKKYAKLEKVLASIRQKRNAFAHGNISESTELGIILQYYDRGPRTDKLNDEYWTELEGQFKEANDILNLI